MEGFVCLCQAGRKPSTQDGSSAGPVFIDRRLPLLTSGYSTWVLVLMLHCVMCLALTGCCKSTLSLTFLYNLMSEKFQGPDCDGYIMAARAVSIFSTVTHPLGVIKKVIICPSETDSFWRICFSRPEGAQPLSHPLVALKKEVIRLFKTGTKK